MPENILLSMQVYKQDLMNLAKKYGVEKEMGVGISVWTVDEPETQQVWLQRDVENITSRNISELIEAREKR